MGIRARVIDPSIAPTLHFASNDSRTSYYLDPRNAYLDTWPSDRFRRGLGFNLKAVPDGAIDEVCRLMAAVGFQSLRTEIAFNWYDFVNRTFGNNTFYQGLLACKKWGLRPLILINSDTSYPCPVYDVVVNLSQAASVGDTVLHFSSVTNMDGGAVTPAAFRADCLCLGVPGHTFNSVSLMASFTGSASAGGTITLSRPLAVAMPAGYNHQYAFWIKPFHPVGTPDYAASLAGFQQYVGDACAYTEGVLGTAGAADRGYDLEVTNEGGNSQFLNINAFYQGQQFAFLEGQPPLTVDLFSHVQAAIHAAHPGVVVADGFTNTDPFNASGPLADADTFHPYARARSVSAANKGLEAGQVCIDALGAVDAGSYTPATTLFFPEDFLTAYFPEQVTRFISAAPSTYYGSPIGRASWGPREFWNTENGLQLDDLRANCGVDVSGWTNAQAERLKGKAYLRLYLANNHAGLDRMWLFCAIDAEPLGFGFLSQALVNQIVGVQQEGGQAGAQPVGAQPTPLAAPVLSPFYLAMQRVMARMPPAAVSIPRRLWYTRVADTHDHSQFAGDGTAAHPTVFDRDVVRFLPYQLTDHSWCALAYVETRDMSRPYGAPGGLTQYDLPPEQFDIDVEGPLAAGLALTCHDPLDDADVPISFTPIAGGLTLHVALTDSPRLITLQESPKAMQITYSFEAVDDNGLYVDGLVFDTSAAGHTPGIKSLKATAAGHADVVPLPAITNLADGTGNYSLAYDANAQGEALMVIDLSGGASPFTGPNRYRKLLLTKDSGLVQAGFSPTGAVDASASLMAAGLPLVNRVVVPNVDGSIDVYFYDTAADATADGRTQQTGLTGQLHVPVASGGKQTTVRVS